MQCLTVDNGRLTVDNVRIRSRCKVSRGNYSQNIHKIDGEMYLYIVAIYLKFYKVLSGKPQEPDSGHFTCQRLGRK